jgi:DNA-binding response OmpR family regulator
MTAEGDFLDNDGQEKVVMPAEAGIQWCRTWRRNSRKTLASGMRRNDGQEKVVMPAEAGIQ